jgi:pimeloyl-ACP methyl ester carboxylesterase
MLPATGCVHLRLHTPPQAAQPLPASIAAEFALAGGKMLQCHESVLEIHRKYTLLRVELCPTASSLGTNIAVDYYRLPYSNSPVIVLLPISGGGYEAESHFARYFAKRGFAVALVRRGEMSHETPTPAAIEAWLKQNMSDNKRVLDWVETREELDAKRIGLFGISMGGIRAALLVALDQRIRAATLGLAGGDLPFILAHSTEKGIARRRADFLRNHPMSVAQFESELRKTITYDPALFAPYVDPRKILVVLGIWDTVVPFKKGWELRKELGRPETLLLPTGHYTAVLCVPYVESQCLRFFRKHLATKGAGVRKRDD